ncbi:type I-C CRISPR-associated protein Cas8c/Csd1 [Streptococcus merionis]|uniref:CRISPR-associated protein n=1 Tax=Streptococcus merionis TaxID=400065 RepID=A0A239STW7_9STRE|nr:type I-C CRISPR-associated protein Cas8c/Csd1 [Streptococcus merionis]SNU88870.1 CRISPR-associated protein [Streptococcus merionis]
MDFFTSLLKTYDKAEETGWVDNPEKGKTLLLPRYHTSLKSNGKNIIFVQLDQSGNFMRAEFMGAETSIVFPVTPDSVARSGKNPAPHPLVDKLSYYVSEQNESQYQTFHRQLESWIGSSQDKTVKSYLELIQGFIKRADFLDVICRSLFGKEYRRDGLKITTVFDGKEKDTDLSACFLEFAIDNFIGLKTVSVSNYQELHQDYIKVVEAADAEKIRCNISGDLEILATKHRGLLGNAKLISVSNNGEAYKGRFREREDVFTVGNKTSEKIHLMAKFLLEREKTHAWLGSGQHLINWFDSDLVNDSALDITASDFFGDYDEEEDETAAFTVKDDNRNISDSFTRGTKIFQNSSTYNAAILNKTNDGRIALKYFRQLQGSRLLKHLEKWQDSYSWERQLKGGVGYYQKTPSFREIIVAAYGVDRGRYLELDNDSFLSDQYQQLVTALLDGQEIPRALVHKLQENIRQRQKYPKTWYQLQYVSLAVLQKQNRKVFTPMIDQENHDRSYLFGRLLAIYELIETQRYVMDGNSQERITNAERYWTAYTGQPAKMMMLLENKIKPYEEVLKLNRPGLWHKLAKEKEQIMERLMNQFTSRQFNQALEYMFLFGYYAEKRFFYTKQVKTESED